MRGTASRLESGLCSCYGKKMMTKSWTTAGGLIVLAVIFALLAILYWVGAIQFLTSTGHGQHHTHGFLFGGLAILSLIAANFARPKNTPDF
jgi:membrane protein implicated in regulation of membrane protease activity